MPSSFLPKGAGLKGGILFKGSGGGALGTRVKLGARNPAANLNSIARGIIKTKIPKAPKVPKLTSSPSMQMPGMPGGKSIAPGTTPFPKMPNPLPKAKLTAVKMPKAPKFAKGMVASKPIGMKPFAPPSSPPMF